VSAGPLFAAPLPRLDRAPLGGVVAVAIADLRRRPDHKSELVSQALFGETLVAERLSPDGRWLLVRGTDDYKGWVRTWSVATGTARDLARWRRSATRIVDRPWLWRGEPGTTSGGPLPFGARLAPRPGGGFDGPLGPLALGRAAGAGTGAFRTVPKARGRSRGDRLRRALVRTGRSFLGVPYLWGGRSPAGLDCSAFVQLVYARHDLALPRDAQDQCTRVGGPRRLRTFDQALQGGPSQGPRAGDLWFFGPKTGGITHVALSTGGLGLLHAYGQVTVGSLNPEHPAFEPELFRAVCGWSVVLRILGMG